MITFKKKNEGAIDLIPDAIDHLGSGGFEYSLIKARDANLVSAKNTKSLVLTSFCETAEGYYEMKIMDKSLYNYTQKLLKDILQMRIVNIDRTSRVITAQVDHLGVALDILEALSLKYNLSIVKDGKI